MEDRFAELRREIEQRWVHAEARIDAKLDALSAKLDQLHQGKEQDMTDTATPDPTPGQRVDEAIAELRAAAQELRAEVQDKVQQFGAAAMQKLTDLAEKLDQKLDELGALIDGDGRPLQ